jgi:23S rRNA (adenine2503-C2)-methyltransferase
MPPHNLKNWSRPALRAWLNEHHEKPFRAEQIFSWLYQHRVESFDEMTNLAKRTREFLNANCTLSRLGRLQEWRSQDGSLKYLFQLQDGKAIETVLMPHHDHYTVCVSSQVGCAMGCDFCVTGRMGLIRNLEPAEIIDQILEAYKDATEDLPLRNIVFMGMGEPFHNYDNVMTALAILTDEHGFNFSQRRITVSTSGLLPQIERFSKEPIKANLAVSLNGVTDAVRSQLMPVNRRYNLEKLVQTCQAYPLEARKRITFEYILMRDVTDSLEDAKALIKLLHGLKFKINLIPFNEAPGSKYKRPDWEQVLQFQRYLLDRGVVATLRISKGQDIQGACGQLSSERQTQEVEVCE